MVETALKEVKVVLKLAEGSQTIAGCSHEASDEQLYALGTAVATLEEQNVEGISKVEESMLINA